MTLRQTPLLDFLCIKKKWVKIALKYCAKLFFLGCFWVFVVVWYEGISRGKDYFYFYM